MTEMKAMVQPRILRGATNVKADNRARFCMLGSSGVGKTSMLCQVNCRFALRVGSDRVCLSAVCGPRVHQ
jgi:putative ribosome biogenesis GTPase RsgA